MNKKEFINGIVFKELAIAKDGIKTMAKIYLLVPLRGHLNEVLRLYSILRNTTLNKKLHIENLYKGYNNILDSGNWVVEDSDTIYFNLNGDEIDIFDVDCDFNYISKETRTTTKTTFYINKNKIKDIKVVR